MCCELLGYIVQKYYVHQQEQSISRSVECEHYDLDRPKHTAHTLRRNGWMPFQLHPGSPVSLAYRSQSDEEPGVYAM